MNDFDLQAKLKAVRVPDWTDEYWEDFPPQVRRQLGRTSPIERLRFSGMPRWGWNGGLAFAGILLVLSLVPVFHAAFKDEGMFRREAERLSQGMRVLMADQHGMKNLITDSE
jgi:hypothetical protein